MNTAREIKPNLWYIGASDRRLALFENVMPVPKGVSYNSYLYTGEQTALLDTADSSVGEQFLENLDATLNGQKLDYMVIHHVEPDHLAMMKEVLLRYPEVKVVCSQQAAKFIGQFFDMDLSGQMQIVKDGDTLTVNDHTLQFVSAPMVHWPEVLVSYDTTAKILFSADAFGTFGALSGNLYADEVDFDRDWLVDARRYYTNIVGKYGLQVQNLLKKAAALDIQMICPLHGPIWRENLEYFIHKHDLWSRYEPEQKGVVIVYGSPYGHTENAATILAGYMAKRGVRDIKMYDVSVTHVSDLVAEAFRYSHIVLAAPTYHNGPFPPMETFLLDLQAHALQGRTFALVENGTWAPQAANVIRKIMAEMKSNTLLEPVVTMKSSLKANQLADLEKLADAIVTSLQA